MSRPVPESAVARSTIGLVSHRRLWPSNRRYPGLAHGWQGAAWVAFKLAGAGAAVPDRVFEAIDRQLAVERAAAPRTRYVGAHVGGTANAVIAAYAARQGSAGKAVARAACKRVVSACRTAAAWDVHTGVAGALLGFAEIAAVEPGALRDVPLRPLVDRVVASVDALCKLPARGWPTGMAHGLAGGVVAIEACGAQGWCRVTSARRQRWLDALSRCAVAAADGALLWPMIAGQDHLGLQSWCAGTPGVALAMLECFRLTRQPVYLEVARGALDGMELLATGALPSRTLCCGNAGYRHIYVEAYRITGEAAWLVHASRRARYASSARPRPALGLHQGELGIAYLAERLASPLAYPFPGLGAASA
jgi:hypothetical protein